MAESNEGQQPKKKTGTSNRGFASMDPARQREIASQGGRAAHEKGTAHEFDSEEARRAGQKGGRASHNRARAAQQQQQQEPHHESSGETMGAPDSTEGSSSETGNT
jgi:general stress protein YciG